MPTWLALLSTVALASLTYLEVRTLKRQLDSGIPYLFFSPHPAYRNSPPNSRSIFFKFSAFGHAWGAIVCGLGTLICAAFLFGIG